MRPESTDTAVAALGEPPVSVETLYRSIETRLRETRPKEDLAPLERAYRFASQRHLGQMRVSGEPYMTHPLLVTRQLASPLGQRPPATLRPLEDFLELLIRAGFSPANALRAYRLFFGFLHGHVLDELQDLIDNPDETDDLFRLGLYRLRPREFPRIRSLALELASYDGAAHLQQGVELMITGLQFRFQPAPAPAT